jgi:alpha-beta hydrolase superfamily lysophospholipase
MAPSRDGLIEVSIPTERGIQLSASYGPALRGGTRATVVFLHGFAAERWENGLFPPLVRAFRERGYATLCYDWRGLGKSGGDFGSSHLQHHVWDFQYVLDWLTSTYDTARSDICAVGFSLGATLIVASAEVDDAVVGRAVLLSPALRPSRDMWPRYAVPGLQEQLSAFGYVLKPETSVYLRRPILESLRDTDVSHRGFNIGIPVLVCHGTKDTRIPVTTTTACMRGARADLVTAVYFNGASHSFRPELPHRNRLEQTICDWLPRLDTPTTRPGERPHRHESAGALALGR